jgi:predicted dehydrogenase
VRVAIIGAGLQARRRAPVVKEWPGAELAVITSIDGRTAKTLAAGLGCESGTGWEDAVKRDDVDVVLVCTPPDSHADISIAAMRAGKDVLCEKPLTRTVDEAERLVAVAEETGRILKCGFNHRHHPAVWQAKALFDKGEIGKPLFGRAVYGIGGRPGFEKEWRADPKVAFGGQLGEQGIHAIDLFRWFFGDFIEATGFTATNYFPIAPLEDNGFALLRTPAGAIVSVHASFTQWRNTFDFEVYGEDGYVRVDGLGGSYGNEKLHAGKKDYYGPFVETVTEFRGPDRSWHEEWSAFAKAIETRTAPIGDGRDGLAAMKLVSAVYESSRTGRAVRVGPG